MGTGGGGGLANSVGLHFAVEVGDALSLGTSSVYSGP